MQKLSKHEMKMVMGGQEEIGDDGGNKCNVYCTSNSQCDEVCPKCVDAGNGKGPNGETKFCGSGNA